MPMSAKFPTANYAIREGNVEGHYSIMVLNDALKGYPYKSEFPWHLWIKIPIVDQQGDNMPTEREAEVLNELEDEFINSLEGVVGLHFIARLTWNGQRELFFYLDDPEKANDVLSAYAESDRPKRQFEYRMEHDPYWNKVAFIYNY